MTAVIIGFIALIGAGVMFSIAENSNKVGEYDKDSKEF